MCTWATAVASSRQPFAPPNPESHVSLALFSASFLRRVFLSSRVYWSTGLNAVERHSTVRCPLANRGSRLLSTTCRMTTTTMRSSSNWSCRIWSPAILISRQTPFGRSSGRALLSQLPGLRLRAALPSRKRSGRVACQRAAGSGRGSDMASEGTEDRPTTTVECGSAWSSSGKGSWDGASAFRRTDR